MTLQNSTIIANAALRVIVDELRKNNEICALTAKNLHNDIYQHNVFKNELKSDKFMQIGGMFYMLLMYKDNKSKNISTFWDELIELSKDNMRFAKMIDFIKTQEELIKKDIMCFLWPQLINLYKNKDKKSILGRRFNSNEYKAFKELEFNLITLGFPLKSQESNNTKLPLTLGGSRTYRKRRTHRNRRTHRK